jgi:GT2 family glycosyltransferase
VSSASVVCGTVLYETPRGDLLRLAKSVSTAAEVAGISCRFSAIDNSGHETEDSFADATAGLIPANLHRSEGNIGFGGGHNRLMRRAFDRGANYYVALNPDGFLHPEAISALITRAKQFDDFALLEARQFPNEHPKIYDFQTLDTPWCSGACLMFTKRVYSEIGGFDDDFFMYCEDVDYSWRTRLSGGRCIMVPDAFFFHDVVGRERSDFVRWHMALSMKRLMSKWLEGVAPLRLTTFLAEMLFDVPASILQMGSKTGALIENVHRNEIAEFRHFFGFAPFRWT